MPDWLQVLVGSLLASIVPLIVALTGRRKINAESTKLKAEAADIVSDTAVQLIEPLRKQIAELEKRVTQLECENRMLKSENAHFAATVERLRSENATFIAVVGKFRDLIRALWEGVITLSAQLEDGMLSPGWHLEQYRQAVEVALNESH